MRPEQCRAARALLGWSQEQLAKAAHVSVNRVNGFESGSFVPGRSTLLRLRAFLVVSGIEFLDDEEGLGIRRVGLRKSPAIVEPNPKTGETKTAPKHGPSISRAQARAARGFLGWSQAETSKRLSVGLSLLVSFEVGTRVPHQKNLQKIQNGFEAYGLRFDQLDGVQTVGLAMPAEPIADKIEL